METVIARGETDMESIRARVFGELVQFALPIIKFYHSDLYRDAVWMQEHVTGPTEFFYGVRDTGTSIGTDESLVSISNRYVYRVALTEEGQKWTVTVEVQ